MKRYWIQFEDDQIGNVFGLGLGCGVTAYNYDDVLFLLGKKVFKSQSVPNPKSVIENVDVSTLDAGHVLPNMAPPNLRGIWFPLGYN